MSISQAFSRNERIGFVVMLVALGLLFQHRDLPLVGALSFKYFSGHFLDFYDVSKSEYLPTTYIVFAIWNLPIWLAGARIVEETDVGLWVFWMKLLPLLFAYLSLREYQALCREIGMDRAQAQWSSLVWLTSPLYLFSLVLFGQHDILPIYLMLRALRSYRNGNLVPFALLMGLAITFKYFAFFLYIPLLLLVEKRPSRLAFNALLFIVPYILVTVPYLSSPAFQSDVLHRKIVQRIFTMGPAYIGSLKLSFFVLAWTFICGAAYYYSFGAKEKAERDVWSIYLCLACFVAFFGLVLWHPQWMIYLTPFATLAAVRHGRPALLFTIETLLFFFFVAYSCRFFEDGVDEQMLVNGLLGASGLLEVINPLLRGQQGAATMSQIFPMLPPALALTCISALLFTYLFFTWPRRPDAEAGWDASLSALQADLVPLRVRCYASLAMFVVPVLICLFSPVERAGLESHDITPPAKVIGLTPYTHYSYGFPLSGHSHGSEQRGSA